MIYQNVCYTTSTNIALGEIPRDVHWRQLSFLPTRDYYLYINFREPNKEIKFLGKLYNQLYWNQQKIVYVHRPVLIWRNNFNVFHYTCNNNNAHCTTTYFSIFFKNKIKNILKTYTRIFKINTY